MRWRSDPKVPVAATSRRLDHAAIRALRAEGLSQRAIAAQLGCSQASVWRALTWGRRSPSERFWSKVDKTADCWEWQGVRRSERWPYGRFWFDGQLVPAHHFAWVDAGGRPPDEGEILMHQCDNPPCVRPTHLRLGTQVDNMQDCIAKGRLRPGGRHVA